tara:strand:- start:505 stop:1728 length:1224 start_codon:yes stop_codon:yes gene_type:complete
MKEKSKYNKSIQDKVNQVEFDYNAADWTALSKQLPSKGLPIFTKIAIGLFTSTIISLAIYFGTKNESALADKTPNPTDIKVDHTPKVTESLDEEKNRNSQNSKEKKSAEVDLEQGQQSAANSNTKQRAQSTIETTNLEQVQTIKEKKDPNKNNGPIANTIKVENTQICFGELISFKLDQPLAANQQLLFNSIPLKRNQNTIQAEKVGSNLLQLKTDDKIIDEVEVQIVEIPVADFIAIKGEEEFAKINYLFEAKSSADQNYEWTIDSKYIGNESEVTHVFKREGKANVQLSVTSTDGCKAINNRTIDIEESFDLLSYDAFTPNGDGINDEFIPKALEANNLKFTMTIYTASGVELYTTNDYYQPWNGRRNNSGEKMTPGVYLWKISVYDDEQQPHPFSGQIKIVNLR